MNQQQFNIALYREFYQIRPKPRSETSVVDALSDTDNNVIKTKKVEGRDGDPVTVAKIIDTTETTTPVIKIHVVILEKTEYSEADIERAVSLIVAADCLPDA